jgi:hypothetical protein
VSRHLRRAALALTSLLLLVPATAALAANADRGHRLVREADVYLLLNEPRSAIR